LDEKGVITLANDRAVRMFTALDIGKLAGRPFAPILEGLGTDGRMPRNAVDRLQEIIAEHSSGKVQLSIDGDRIFEVTVSSGQQRTVLLFEDITERVLADERISFIARHDALTGLPNRSYFGILALEQLQERAAAGDSSTLMIVD